MADSKYIAGLVGPTLIAVTLSEIVNPDIWRAVTAPDTYQAGLLAFVGGLAIVRAHNIWTLRWPVVLTLVGWFGVAGGLARMFLTEAARQSAGDASIALGLEAALLGVGLFLTFKAYAPGGQGAADR
jgi:prepilin signal peptidase PulO-like enzyme (type II secretory pathway)